MDQSVVETELCSHVDVGLCPISVTYSLCDLGQMIQPF